MKKSNSDYTKSICSRKKNNSSSKAAEQADCRGIYGTLSPCPLSSRVEFMGAAVITMVVEN
jgi:hypothetical protein